MFTLVCLSSSRVYYHTIRQILWRAVVYVCRPRLFNIDDSYITYILVSLMFDFYNYYTTNFRIFVVLVLPHDQYFGDCFVVIYIYYTTKFYFCVCYHSNIFANGSSTSFSFSAGRIIFILELIVNPKSLVAVLSSFE